MTMTDHRGRRSRSTLTALLTIAAIGVGASAHAAQSGEANEPLGACCYKDPSNNPICQELTEHVCMDYQGTWYGAGVLCSAPSVTCGSVDPEAGACCADLPGSGLGCTPLTLDDCESYGGLWFGPGVPCTDPQVQCHGNSVPGACCYEDPTLGLICVQIIEEFCIDAGGYWYGPGTVCTDPQVECPPLPDRGACCYSNADGALICDELMEPDCKALLGTWYGPGVACTDPIVDCAVVDPVDGACCYEDPTFGLICVQIIEEFCIDAGGYWYGPGTVCTDPQVECPPLPDRGACCYSNADGALICDELMEPDCKALLGTWYGPGVACTDPIVDCAVVDPVDGACCYEDPTLGLICVQIIEEFCMDAGGYWYGPGTVCTDPQVDCDPPTSGCVVTPGSTCAGRPAYTDPAFEQVFGDGSVAVETASPSVFGGSVVTVFDLTLVNAAPLDSWFAVNRFSDPDWNPNVLGSVFGLAVNDQGDIFVTTTRSWTSDWVGMGGWGAVYRLDRITGDVTIFASLPNNSTGLGSITWDCDHQVFFVTNMEDGLIYRLDSAGNILDTFDPASPSTGAAGPVALGDRPWAVEVHDGRLYFSMWNENIYAGSATVANEIWSVELDASGMPIGTEMLEISLPALGSTNWSAPVSDIRFSPAGSMLLAERSMFNFETVSAHQARLLEYECENGSWVPSANAYSVGEIGGTNAAGGVDADQTRTWVSGDALHLNNPAPYSNIYGFQGLPNTGGSNADSLLIDYQDQLGLQDKHMLGDLVVTTPKPESCLATTVFGATCRMHHYNGAYHQLSFGFSVLGSSTIDEVQLAGPNGISFGPATLTGPFPPYQSYPVNVNLFGATSGLPMCVDVIAVFADGSSCSTQMCFDPPACTEPYPGDVTYDQKVDISDLLALLEAWGYVCDAQEDCPEDLDADGRVGIGDLLELLANWSGE